MPGARLDSPSLTFIMNMTQTREHDYTGSSNLPLFYTLYMAQNMNVRVRQYVSIQYVYV